jgi:oligopeptidase B
VPVAPRARIRPTRFEKHGHVRIDDYDWLRERDDPEVRAHLGAENEHLREVMAHAAGLEEDLYREIIGRIKRDDATVPYRLGEHFYYVRFAGAAEYPIYCRKHEGLDRPEQVMLDANEMAAGHEFFSIGGLTVSPRGGVLAFAVDTVGRRIHTLRFKDLGSGELLRDEIPHVTGNQAWAEDDRTLFYTRQDPVTLRWHQLWRHVLGTDPAQDVLVYEEADTRFQVSVLKTKSRKYLLLACSQTRSDEWRWLDAHDPSGTFTVILPREPEHEYSVDHHGEHFYIRTNWQAENFRLVRAPVARPGREQWTDVVAHRPDVLVEGCEVFRDHLVVELREDGLVRLDVRPWSGAPAHSIEFDEPAYCAWVGDNHEIDTTSLRYGYTSLTTPRTIYDYDLVTRARTLQKRDEVLGDFDSARYVTERIHATARDGTRVPISLVHRREVRRDGTPPLLLYGYGAYGASTDATFRSERLSLLDRGFVFAIAHVRGGEELGRAWYEAGRVLRKKNTFHDFIDCAEHLVHEGYASRDLLFARGGSAGGLLVGAVLNMRPDLWKGAIAVVPFVDVLTSMLDESMPLTTGEYDEWGDPNVKEHYDYILSYCPYDNVETKAYPHLLVTAGLHDSQVQYWEPAKWVAKLRARKTDGNRLLLHTNMDAGHGGASGRFRYHRETAREYAFLLDLAGRSSASIRS